MKLPKTERCWDSLAEELVNIKIFQQSFINPLHIPVTVN